MDHLLYRDRGISCSIDAVMEALATIRNGAEGTDMSTVQPAEVDLLYAHMSTVKKEKLTEYALGQVWK